MCKLAANRIFNIRRNPFKQHLSGRLDNSLVREFTQPMMNFTANHFSEMNCYDDNCLYSLHTLKLINYEV